MHMNKVVWLVAGNKGGAGKSIVAKSLAEWLGTQEAALTIVDGDRRTPDVYATFSGILPAVQFDLGKESGWPHFSDFLCNSKLQGHVVTNLPDAISDRAILYFQRLQRLADSYGFEVKVMFVMNSLPDGLYLFSKLTEVFDEVVPAKNLFFGNASDFTHFDAAYGRQFSERVLLFPKMKPALMQVYRESHLTLAQFIAQSGDTESNFTYAKIAVADWRDSMLEAIDDVLLGG